MEVTITMHLLSSTIKLKMRKRLSIMLCTLDHNHTWHRYSLCTSSYAIAPKHVLRSQCSVKHTASVLTLRLRTRQAMEPGAGTKGIPILAPSAGITEGRHRRAWPLREHDIQTRGAFDIQNRKTNIIHPFTSQDLFSPLYVTENWNRKHFLHNSLLLLLLLLLLAA